MKKSLTILLVAVMILCMMPVCSIFADESGSLPTLNVDVDTSTLGVIPMDTTSKAPTVDGLSTWAGEEVEKMFDGLYGVPATITDNTVYDRADTEKGTKMGGEVVSEDHTVTVTFSTVGQSKVEYYSLYTGFDTGWEVGRNPIAWTLYGMGETDWVELQKIESSDTAATGMQNLPCTPYTYQIPTDKVGEYSDYKIVFTVGDADYKGYMQLNELVMYGTAKLNTNVDTSKLGVIEATNPAAEGITPWGGEEVDKLFDGQYGVTSDDATQDPYSRTAEEKGTKLGGQVTSEDKKVTVTFSTNGENPIEYYTFVTGFDATQENGRNPISWTFSALRNGKWMVLDEVVGSENVSTGLEDINCGVYTYAVPQSAFAQKAYTEYKFEFTVSGDYFQMNEIILLGAAADNGTSDGNTDTPPATTPDTGDTPANTTAATTTKAPETNNAPTTGDTTNNTTDNDSGNNTVIIIVAVVAVVVVVAIIVIVVVSKKKKA